MLRVAVFISLFAILCKVLVPFRKCRLKWPIHNVVRGDLRLPGLGVQLLNKMYK